MRRGHGPISWEMEAVAAVIREMTPVEKYDGLFDLDWMIPALGDLRATIKAKDAEIVEQKGHVISQAKEAAGFMKLELERTIERNNERVRADAAEARVKKLDKLSCDLANESTERGVRIAALELELAEAKKIMGGLIDAEGPWHWMGDGGDCPESLACPVLMSAGQARELSEARRDTARLTEFVWRVRNDDEWPDNDEFDAALGCTAIDDALMAEREG